MSEPMQVKKKDGTSINSNTQHNFHQFYEKYAKAAVDYTASRGGAS